MANAVLPLRAGELARVVLASKSERVSMSTALATVIVERVIDLGTVALLLFLLRFVMPLPAAAEAASWLSGLGLAAALGVFGAALAARPIVLRALQWAEARVPLLGRIRPAMLLSDFLDGLAFIRRPLTLASVIAWTAVVWCASGISVYLGAAAVGVWKEPEVALFALLATSLSLAVPSAPGYVGVFHAAFVAAYVTFGVEEGPALAAAIVVHALGFGTVVAAGAYYLVVGRATLPTSFSLRSLGASGDAPLTEPGTR